MVAKDQLNLEDSIYLYTQGGLMKVIHSTNFFKPSWESGGPARIAYELSREMVNLGHDVTVYTTDGYKYRLSVKKNVPIDVDGIETYYFENLSLCLAKKLLLTTPYCMPFVARKEILDFDILHIHEPRTIPGSIVHYYASKYSIPYVLQAHGAIQQNLGRQHLKIAFDLLFGKKLLRDASKVIAINNIEAIQYSRMGIDKDKIRIVPNGINISDYKDLPQRGDFKNIYNIKDNEKIILYLGRLSKIKGLDFLLKAFSILVRDCCNLKLVIAGPDDGMLAYIINLISCLHLMNNVILTGPIYDRIKLMAYVDADILVYPSKYEIFGLVPLEAIMCGTPVIVTDDSGCGELIKNAECGYVIKYGSKEDLINSIKYIFNNYDEAKKRVEYGQLYIKTNLDWKKITKKVLNIYEDCHA